MSLAIESNLGEGPMGSLPVPTVHRSASPTDLPENAALQTQLPWESLADEVARSTADLLMLSKEAETVLQFAKTASNPSNNQRTVAMPHCHVTDSQVLVGSPRRTSEDQDCPVEDVGSERRVSKSCDFSPGNNRERSSSTPGGALSQSHVKEMIRRWTDFRVEEEVSASPLRRRNSASNGIAEPGNLGLEANSMIVRRLTDEKGAYPSFEKVAGNARFVSAPGNMNSSGSVFASSVNTDEKKDIPVEEPVKSSSPIPSIEPNGASEVPTQEETIDGASKVYSPPSKLPIRMTKKSAAMRSHNSFKTKSSEQPVAKPVKTQKSATSKSLQTADKSPQTVKTSPSLRNASKKRDVVVDSKPKDYTGLGADTAFMKMLRKQPSDKPRGLDGNVPAQLRLAELREWKESHGRVGSKSAYPVAAGQQTTEEALCDAKPAAFVESKIRNLWMNEASKKKSAPTQAVTVSVVESTPAPADGQSSLDASRRSSGSGMLKRPASEIADAEVMIDHPAKVAHCDAAVTSPRSSAAYVESGSQLLVRLLLRVNGDRVLVNLRPVQSGADYFERSGSINVDSRTEKEGVVISKTATGKALLQELGQGTTCQQLTQLLKNGFPVACLNSLVCMPVTTKASFEIVNGKLMYNQKRSFIWLPKRKFAVTRIMFERGGWQPGACIEVVGDGQQSTIKPLTAQAYATIVLGINMALQKQPTSSDVAAVSTLPWIAESIGYKSK